MEEGDGLLQAIWLLTLVSIVSLLEGLRRLLPRPR